MTEVFHEDGTLAFRPRGRSVVVEIDPDIQSKAIETVDGRTVQLVTGCARIEREKVLLGTIIAVGKDVVAKDELSVGRRIGVPHSMGWVLSTHPREIIVSDENPDFILFTGTIEDIPRCTPAPYGPSIRGRL